MRGKEEKIKDLVKQNISRNVTMKDTHFFPPKPISTKQRLSMKSSVLYCALSLSRAQLYEE